jgi:cathepsin L
MKHVLLPLVVILLPSACIAPAGAQQPRPPLRQGTVGRPGLTAQSLAQSMSPAYLRLLQTHKSDKRFSKLKQVKSSTRSFDWTELGIATRVRDQGHAGTCWAQAGVEALEANFELTANDFPMLSVQPILDQLQHSQGGDACLVFPELKSKGTGLAKDHPYLVGKLNPKPKGELPYKAMLWGYVGTGYRPATTLQIKAALLQFGPLYTTMHAGSPAFRANRGQVLAEKGPFKDVNHAVLIVGWDDARKAWKIKNSWGEHRWGDRGFGWVAYDHYRIGTSTAWVRAQVKH